MSRCLITGCELFVVAEGKQLHGDLHEIGESWLFVGVVWENVVPAWYFPNSPRESVPPAWRGSKKLLVTGDYFERRGVITVPKEFGRLNPEAEAYVAKWAGSPV